MQTLKGLYLFESIDMNESFVPSDQFKRYMKKTKIKELKFNFFKGHSHGQVVGQDKFRR